MADNVVEEYVVKLGTMVDNEGVNRILSFFDSSKMKALGLGAAVAGATAAVYKFIEAATANEFELAKLAKQKKKSVELTRAENNAMKAMGKTMAEINKDQNLKKIYKDLVEFNKEMAMPNTSKALDNIRNLEVAFAKLKSVVNTAVQYINAQMLINLERPIERITGKVGSIADWLKENMKQYAPKIATVLTDFALGIMGIVEAGGKLLKWFNQLDPAIKSVGETVLWLLAIVKGGTIGRVLMLINAVGAVIQDYNNYKWNQEHPNEEPIPTINDAFGIWDLFESDDPKKWEQIATKSVEYLTAWLDSAFQDFDMTKIFGDGTEAGQGIFGSILKWFKENESVIDSFGESLLAAILRGIREVGGTTGGIGATIINALFGDGTSSDYIFDDADGSAATTLAGSIGGFVYGFAEKLKDKNGNVWQALKAGMKDMSIGSIIASIVANMSNEGGVLTVDWDSVGADLSSVGDTVISVLAAGIDVASDVGSILMTHLATAISGISLGNDNIQEFTSAIGGVFSQWADNETLMGGISTAVTAAFSGANLMESIIAGIFGSFTQASDKEMREYLRGKSFGDEWLNSLSHGALKDLYDQTGGDTTYWTRIFGDLGSAGGDLISGLFNALFEGAELANGLGADLWAKLMQTLGSVLKIDPAEFSSNAIGGALSTAIATAGLGGSFLQSLLAGLASGIAGVQDLADTEYGDFMKALEVTAGDLWKQIKTIWYGKLDENGNAVSEDAGLSGVFKRLFGGGEGGMDLKSKIIGWLEPVGDAIVAFFSSLWIRIYNSAPSWLKDALGTLGYNDMNHSSLANNPEGGYTISSTRGNDGVSLTPEQAKVLAPYLDIISSDGEGNWVFTGDATEKGKREHNGTNMNYWLTRFIKGEVTEDKFMKTVGAYGKWNEVEGYDENAWANLGLGEKVYKHGSLYYRTNEDGSGQRWSSGKGEWVDATEAELKNVKESANTLAISGLDPLALSAENASNTFAEIEEKLGGVSGDIDGISEAIASAVVTINKAIAGIGKGDKKAWGGRIGSEGQFTVGEDGPEYIIPITKPKRAMELINNALSEMGMSAMSKFSGDLGIGGGSGALGGALEALVGSMNGGSTTVSAPVNIYVTATGADGRDIGVGIYDTAERQLIRTLTGVV